MKWKTVKLGEVCDLIAGFAFKAGDFGDYPSKVVKIKDIAPSMDNTGLDGVDMSKYNSSKLDKFVLQRGDFVAAMTGSLGKIGRYLGTEKVYVNQRVLKFVPKDSVDWNFIYYSISTWEFYQYVLNHIDSQSVQPNISATTIGKYEFPLPPLETQRRIAAILSSLDDKIENNNRINRNLEAQAQALFKSWFVDFEPWVGVMPDDWKEGKLGDLCITNKRTSNGKYNTYINYIDTGSVTKNRLNDVQVLNPTIDKIPSRARRLVSEGDIIYSSVRPNQCHYMFMYDPSPDIVVSTGFVVITANWSAYRYYIYQYIIQESTVSTLQAIAEQSVSTYPSINASDITNLNIIIPSNDIIEKFANVMNKVMQRIEELNKESKRLAALRDSLLPKLMKGEIAL